MTLLYDKEKVQQSINDLRRQLHEIKVEVLPGGTLPVKAHATDAGFDLFAIEDIIIFPGQVIRHPLNIKLTLPASTYMSVESKSGLGAKGLLVFGGVIDEGYRGVISAVISNIRSRDDEGNLLDIDAAKITVKKGQKLAQMIPFPFSTAYYITQVDKVNTNTDRSAGGFGSSGV